MTKIILDSQPDPDWTHFTYARWERDNKGVLLLDFGIQNFGPSNPGAEIEIGYDLTGGCLIGPNTTKEVSVKISYQRGTLTALGADPDYPELVERKAVLHAERCNHNFLHISLGGTGALASDEFRRVRYRFVTDFVAELARNLPEGPFLPRFRSDDIGATAAGGHLYPAALRIDQDTHAAWSFTALHEVAHLWLGATGISGASIDAQIERYCNRPAMRQT